MHFALFDALRPLFARLVAAAISALSALLVGKFNFSLGTEAELALSSFVLLAVYAIVHKLLNRSINPSDAASVTVTRIENDKQEARHAQEASVTVVTVGEKKYDPNSI